MDGTESMLYWILQILIQFIIIVFIFCNVFMDATDEKNKKLMEMQ